jgi:hypothetical protein
MGSHFQTHEYLKPSSQSAHSDAIGIRGRLAVHLEEGGGGGGSRDAERRRTPNSHTRRREKANTSQGRDLTCPSACAIAWDTATPQQQTS